MSCSSSKPALIYGTSNEQKLAELIAQLTHLGLSMPSFLEAFGKFRLLIMDFERIYGVPEVQDVCCQRVSWHKGFSTALHIVTKSPCAGLEYKEYDANAGQFVSRTFEDGDEMFRVLNAATLLFEDTSLGFDAMGGVYPGALIKHALKHNPDLYPLVQHLPTHAATASCTMTLVRMDENQHLRTHYFSDVGLTTLRESFVAYQFEGSTRGRIVPVQAGEHGGGWDANFHADGKNVPHNQLPTAQRFDLFRGQAIDAMLAFLLTPRQTIIREQKDALDRLLAGKL